MTEEFQRAGIEILAVSTDSVADIKKSLVDAKEDGKYPFPIVSDNSMQVFKAYRIEPTTILRSCRCTRRCCSIPRAMSYGKTSATNRSPMRSSCSK